MSRTILFNSSVLNVNTLPDEVSVNVSQIDCKILSQFLEVALNAQKQI